MKIKKDKIDFNNKKIINNLNKLKKQCVLLIKNKKININKMLNRFDI